MLLVAGCCCSGCPLFSFSFPSRRSYFILFCFVLFSISLLLFFSSSLSHPSLLLFCSFLSPSVLLLSLLFVHSHPFISPFTMFCLFCSLLFFDARFFLFVSLATFLFCSVLLCSHLFFSCSPVFCSVLYRSVLFCSVPFCSILFASTLFSSIFSLIPVCSKPYSLFISLSPSLRSLSSIHFSFCYVLFCIVHCASSLSHPFHLSSSLLSLTLVCSFPSSLTLIHPPLLPVFVPLHTVSGTFSLLTSPLNQCFLSITHTHTVRSPLSSNFELGGRPTAWNETVIYSKRE